MSPLPAAASILPGVRARDLPETIENNLRVSERENLALLEFLQARLLDIPDWHPLADTWARLVLDYQATTSERIVPAE